MPPLFSVSEFTTWDLTFEQDVALYQKLGISGIEICERKLAADPKIAREQLAAFKDTGLKITSVQPRVHALFHDSMSPEIADPVKRIQCFRETIDLFSAAFPGQNIPLIAISGNAPQFNFRLAHETARKLYPPLADYAAGHGLRIMFEPLNPILMNADSFICDLHHALQLLADVHRPNFGLMLDVWHVWHEHNIGQRIAALAGKIFGVHICDWPRNWPRHVGDRVLPGDGIIDLPGLFGAIEKSGYAGAYCLEIFSIHSLPNSLWRADPAQVIAQGKAGFEQAWNARKNPEAAK